jgi:hypothetical protein
MPRPHAVYAHFHANARHVAPIFVLAPLARDLMIRRQRLVMFRFRVSAVRRSVLMPVVAFALALLAASPVTAPFSAAAFDHGGPASHHAGTLVKDQQDHTKCQTSMHATVLLPSHAQADADVVRVSLLTDPGASPASRHIVLRL